MPPLLCMTILHIWFQKPYKLGTICRPPSTITLRNSYLKYSTMWLDNMHIQPLTVTNDAGYDLHGKSVFNRIISFHFTPIVAAAPIDMLSQCPGTFSQGTAFELCGNANEDKRVDLGGGSASGIVPTVCLSPRRL